MGSGSPCEDVSEEQESRVMDLTRLHICGVGKELMNHWNSIRVSDDPR